MNIPLVDLKAQYATLEPEILQAVDQVLRSADFINGSAVERFEREFACWLGAEHCVGVGNGTDALVLALQALGVGSGHEVVVPANSFIATSEAVSLAGALPVFADVDPHIGCMTAETVLPRLGERTKALIPVHLHGHPAPLEALGDLAQRHNLALVQDCAQAHGVQVGGRGLADYGGLLCYSFYPGKNLGAYGDAGAVVGNHGETIEKVRRLANHGRLEKFDHLVEGGNSRLDTLQAAILEVKLRHLTEWTARRREIAVLYGELLADCPGLELPAEAPWAFHVYHLYVVRTPHRDALREHLGGQGIATGIHYPTALPLLPAYAEMEHRAEDFPASVHLAETILSLPVYPEMDNASVARVAHSVRACMEKHG